jgi:hypothetical protein
MIALRSGHDDDLTLDPEARAALLRFDEDAQTLCAASSMRGPSSPCTLHARATASYRDALANAAGVPRDRRWGIFFQTVAALIAASVVGTAQPRVASAAARLRRLVEENADLLPSDIR